MFRRLPGLLAAALAASAAGGCSSSLPKSVSGAPVLSVVTGLWPLAQAAGEIGGDKVAVDDLIPSGTDPFAYQPDAAATRILHSSGLVLEVGGGFQPGFEQAAQGAPKVLGVRATTGTDDPYVWLDPVTMGRAVGSIADAMAAANPAAAPLYRSNAGALQDEIRSLGMDYSSTLSSCPGTTIVVPDPAFTAMAGQYGLQAHVIGPSPTPSRVAAEKAGLQTGRAVAALTQPWVDNSGVEQVAAAAGLKVRAVDTLALPPAGGSPQQNTYFARMEQILGVVSGALGCNPNEQ